MIDVKSDGIVKHEIFDPRPLSDNREWVLQLALCKHQTNVFDMYIPTSQVNKYAHKAHEASQPQLLISANVGEDYQ